MMNDIDWSKAPEGATHWDTGMNNRVAGWMKLDDGIWYWWPVKDAGCAMKWHASLNQHLIRPEGFVARPVPWNGEGLPPVGTVCELWIRADEWAKCQVIAMDEQDGHPVSVVRYGGGYYAGTNKCLRPIRTPEQIAIEERETVVAQMLSEINYAPFEASHYLVMAERLYDAGYRKTDVQ